MHLSIFIWSINLLFLITLTPFSNANPAVDSAVKICQASQRNKICECSTNQINCDKQELSTVNIQPPDVFDNVAVLSMKSNKITRIGHGSNQLLAGKGERLTQLTLSNNLIQQIDNNAFITTPALEYLDLSSNKIINLTESTFSGLSNLITMKLDHNLIENLSNFGNVFGGLDKLQYLTIDYTPIKSISNETFMNLDSLVELTIDHAELSCLPIDAFKSLSKLETLSLRHNRFKIVPMESLGWLGQLKRIDFSGNPIITINSNAFRRNTQLHNIVFYNMPELRYVEDCAFCNVHELRTLEIVNSGKLTDFDPEAFGRDIVYFQNIETIDLVNNSLTTLDEDMLAWENVSLIRLSGNPWKCDCELLWMVDVKMKIDQQQLPVCDLPSNYKGQTVTQLRQLDSTFCMFHRMSSRVRTARLFLIVAVLIIVSAIITTTWYLINNRRKNGLKLRNLFYKPQLPKYAYRNLAMGDDVEQDLPSGVVINDDTAIIPKKQNRDLASRLADDS